MLTAEFIYFERFKNFEKIEKFKKIEESETENQIINSYYYQSINNGL